MKNIDWKNLAERAFWTFVEGFIGALMLPSTVIDADAWKSVLIASALAGISAVKTLVLDVVKRNAITEKSDD